MTDSSTSLHIGHLQVVSGGSIGLYHTSGMQQHVHLVSNTQSTGTYDDKKQAFAQQVVHLDKSYHGGLLQYIANARRLLEESRVGTQCVDVGVEVGVQEE